MDIQIKQLEYTVIFEPDEDGCYVAYVPALDNIATQGETLSEAKAMAKDLIQGYLQTFKKKGLPLPKENVSYKPRIEKLMVGVLK